MSKAAGISPSYLSDFERGFKLPTVKYLKYLHDNHNVDLNYVFGSSGRMLRQEAGIDLTRDFGNYSEDIEELLTFLSQVPHSLHSVLAFFTKYKMENQKLIAKYKKTNERITRAMKMLRKKGLR